MVACPVLPDDWIGYVARDQESMNLRDYFISPEVRPMTSSIMTSSVKSQGALIQKVATFIWAV